MSASEPTGNLAAALTNAARLLDSTPAAAAEQAAEILKVVPDQPNALALQGLALGRLGRGEDAIVALKRAVKLQARAARCVARAR